MPLGKSMYGSCRARQENRWNLYSFMAILGRRVLINYRMPTHACQPHEWRKGSQEQGLVVYAFLSFRTTA